ncbi:hypothetical protein ACFL37_02130 [Candidatus Margulisiibacteriota bacterium]
MRFLAGLFLVLVLAAVVCAEDAGPPYVYKFPKPEANWGQAVSFHNLSPGFFQVMFQNKEGEVRIATYGIVGASMDKLKDPQLMMVFAFEEKAEAGSNQKDVLVSKVD